MNFVNNNKIWGISYEEIHSGDYLLWKFQIRNPFRKENKWVIGLGDKLLRSAISSGVNKFIVQIGQQEMMMEIHTAKELKRKTKAREFEDKKSMFENGSPMRIFYFKI